MTDDMTMIKINISLKKTCTMMLNFLKKKVVAYKKIMIKTHNNQKLNNHSRNRDESR